MSSTMRGSCTGAQRAAFSSGSQRAVAPRLAAECTARRALRASRAAGAPALAAAAAAAAAAAPAAGVRAARRTAVAVAAVAEQSVAAQQQQAGNKTWYALVANAEFFINDPQNESLAEQLREKVRYFKEQGRDADFYLVPNPTWLDERYPTQAKQVRRPAMALVSTDETWITFMKLRLDRVLRFDLGALPADAALAAGAPLPEFPKPAKWTAPYPMYTPGWWKVFYPPGAQ